MTYRSTTPQFNDALWDRASVILGDRPRQKFIALTLVAALLAFEASLEQRQTNERTLAHFSCMQNERGKKTNKRSRS